MFAIAAGAGLASFAMNFWIPFLPLFMKELGATSDANALFWVAIATTGQGFARLVAGPAWGVLSDRVGRKVMYVRALAFATATTLIAAFATEPWHVAVAFGCQGLFSGFIPAAVALTSVTVPEERLTSGLGAVTAAQYIGNTAGPAVGAALALLFGLRGAILAGAMMPALAAVAVFVVVPRDRVEREPRAPGEVVRGAEPRMRSVFLGPQFMLAVALYFFLFASGQLLRLTVPIGIEDLTARNAEGLVGIAFTASGVASVVGVLLVGRRFVRPGLFGRAIGVGMVLTAVSLVLLALAPNVGIYVAVFAVASLLQAAVLPATNTLIAANVPRNRRGTAFGIASSAQALAFMAGPMGAAVIAAFSLGWGYVALGALMAMAGLAALRVREPLAQVTRPQAADVAPLPAG